MLNLEDEWTNPWTHELLIVPRALYLFVWSARHAPSKWELTGLADSAIALVSAVYYRCPQAALCLVQTVDGAVTDMEAAVQAKEVLAAVKARLDSIAHIQNSPQSLRFLGGDTGVVCRVAGDCCDVKGLLQALVHDAASLLCKEDASLPPAYALLWNKIQQEREQEVRPWLTWKEFIQMPFFLHFSKYCSGVVFIFCYEKIQNMIAFD